jgi:hypothetical protein
VVAATVALVGLSNQDLWLVVMFGIIAVSSLQAIEGERRRSIPAYRRWRD